MTIDTAKELQMNIAKEGLALLPHWDGVGHPHK